MIKKLWKIFAGLQIALLVTLLAVTPVSAAELRGYDDVIVASGDVVDDDLYIAGNRVVVNGTVNGDVLAAGSTIIIDGTVNGDLIALGSTVRVSGEVTGTARMAGSTIDVSGIIGKDVVVAGSRIEISDAAEIGRDLVFGGSTVRIDSLVNGDLLGAGQVIDFLDEIGGNAVVDVRDLTISSTAVINGNLVYTSENEADIASGAVISGEISRKIPEGNRWYNGWIISPAMRIWGHIISYLMVLVIGIIIVMAAPDKTKETANAIMTKPWQSLGWGALILFVTPIAVVVSILTVIGIPIGLIALLLWGLLIFLAQLVTGFFIGYWIVNRMNMPETRGSLVLALFIGFTLLTLVKLIPFIGWIFWVISVLFGTGAVAMLFIRRRKQAQDIPVEVIGTSQEQTL